MRKCQITYKEWNIKENKKGVEKTEDCLFHVWGVTSDGDGGSDTIGIVELSDGTIKTEYPQNIRFDVPDTKEFVPGAPLKEKGHLECWMFTGVDYEAEQYLRNFLKEIRACDIFKILQSESCLNPDNKSLTITVLYYK